MIYKLSHFLNVTNPGLSSHDEMKKAMSGMWNC